MPTTTASTLANLYVSLLFNGHPLLAHCDTWLAFDSFLVSAFGGHNWSGKVLFGLHRYRIFFFVIAVCFSRLQLRLLVVGCLILFPTCRGWCGKDSVDGLRFRLLSWRCYYKRSERRLLFWRNVRCFHLTRNSGPPSSNYCLSTQTSQNFRRNRPLLWFVCPLNWLPLHLGQ